MRFELNGIVYHLTIKKEYKNENTLRVFTETPCCTDLSYSTIINDKEVRELNTAIENNQVYLEQSDDCYVLELIYGDIIHTLDYDEYDIDPVDLEEQLKNYYDLKKEMSALRKELKTVQDVLHEVFKGEGIQF